ncbi:hypothetical protein SNE40_010416 [Patella caerulea]|uniref:Uncharacterized protein n=1 Tax=Patella caerulea TaxID=87958 RepID=A0AAN8JQE8_PATCE
MSQNVSRAELNFQLKQLKVSKQLELENNCQDRESARVQRYIDKEIKSTKEDLADIKASTSVSPTPRRRRGSVPSITITSHPQVLTSSERYSHYQEGDHLKIKTRHNLLMSDKLSKNLQKLEERKRERSLSPCRDMRPVSAKSLENLYLAANVLRGTEHGAEAKHLLETVTCREKHP